jgi:hypothetical protein
VLDSGGEPPERGLPDATLATLRSPREGVIVDSLVDLTALRTVVDLRERFGGFEAGVDVAAVRDGRLGLLDERFTAATIVQFD